jgi:hypothetical protein
MILFLQNYMQPLAKEGFCETGSYAAPTLSFIHRPNHTSQTPRYLVLKKLPQEHLEAFAQKRHNGQPVLSSATNSTYAQHNKWVGSQ